MSSRAFRNRTALGAGGVLIACGLAQGQSFSTGFEPPTYTGSAAGTPTTPAVLLGVGQDGWYLPNVAGSQPHSIYTYAGNTLNMAVNPNGGSQFDGGMGVAAGSARAQHAVDFSSGGTWQAEFDVTGVWAGAALPAVDNLGSFSLQTSGTTRYFQQLMSWGATAITGYPGGPNPPANHTAMADLFHMPIGRATAAVPGSINFELASAAWSELPVNHWYHVTLRWNFDTSTILQVSIRDITTGGPTTTDDVSGRGWYLLGGPTSTLPLPTDIRVFAGGAGDATGWDNINVFKVFVSTCYANCDASTNVPFLNVNDFACFQAAFAAGQSYANCDNSTIPPILSVNDFICFQGKFAAGCSAP